MGVEGVVDVLGRGLKEAYLKKGIKGDLEGRMMVTGQKVWSGIWERAARTRGVCDVRRFVWADIRATGVDSDGLRGEMEVRGGEGEGERRVRRACRGKGWSRYDIHIANTLPSSLRSW